MYFKLFTKALFFHPYIFLLCHPPCTPCVPAQAAEQNTLITPGEMLADEIKKRSKRQSMKVLRTWNCVTLVPKPGFPQAAAWLYLPTQYLQGSHSRRVMCSYISKEPQAGKGTCFGITELYQIIPGSCNFSQVPVCIGSCLLCMLFSPSVAAYVAYSSWRLYLATQHKQL